MRQARDQHTEQEADDAEDDPPARRVVHRVPPIVRPMCRELPCRHRRRMAAQRCDGQRATRHSSRRMPVSISTQ
jgi:hypothetical protein